MQPYTPHGDSNVNATGDSVRVAGCNLIPLTGTVTFAAEPRARIRKIKMQPYTPHGDSNNGLTNSFCDGIVMQPYTPHGDSNITGCIVNLWLGWDATLYPSRGQ